MPSLVFKYSISLEVTITGKSTTRLKHFVLSIFTQFLIRLSHLHGMNGSGGSVGIECSPTGPGFASRRPFSASVSVTLTLDVGLFYLSVFLVQLVKSTPILISFFFSHLLLCASCANVLSLSLFSIYLTLLEPSINTKLLLCGPVEQGKNLLM